MENRMKFVGIFITLLIVVLYALSWLITCGLVKLITLCFGWAFSWPIATGIWLILVAVKHLYPSSKNNGK
jgi:hypothetical protein